MSNREALLSFVASEIKGSGEKPIIRVAIDGVDGAGKTRFADELACLLGEHVIRASVDDFHNPRSARYAQGKDSPEGFFEDSFNYAKLRELLLDPLSDSPPRRYCGAYFNHRTDSEIDLNWKSPPTQGILLFDGIFSHRPELAGYWDYSLFLEISTSTSVQRCIDREGVSGVSYDANDPIHARYVQGQALYLETCQPSSKCSRRIINEVINAPVIAV